MYSKVLREFDWPGLVKQARGLPCSEQGCALQVVSGEPPMHMLYLGSVLSLSPSGKYYTPFANSNVTFKEARVDEAWYAALDRAAEKFSGSIESGEGDPCDLFFALPCPRPCPRSRSGD